MMFLQHNGGGEPSQFDGELERQLSHLFLPWKTLSGCSQKVSPTKGVDIKIHFRQLSVSVKFPPFVAEIGNRPKKSHQN